MSGERIRKMMNNMSMKMRSKTRDVEAELNLPPGFRFHPTDEELVLHYLCRKVSCHRLPVPIIPEVDLYRYDPWQLPDMALFGTKEWYFFSPRDRKYPNGLRPNRAAGHGYWKATGADKPIRPTGCAYHIGIKKALVFYSGKAPSGTKTNWIMHEYRLAQPNRPSIDKNTLRLDGWVLCRIYNKKNNWEKIQNIESQPASEEIVDSSGVLDHHLDGITTPESGISNDQQLAVPELLHDPGIPAVYQDHDSRSRQHQALDGARTAMKIKEDIDWNDLQNSLAESGATLVPNLTYQDYCFSCVWSPHSKPFHANLLPF